MPAANPAGDVSAMAHLNMAREYLDAANRLLDLNQGRAFSNPINFLYFHAIELALKAFLRSFGTRRKGHKLRLLYEQCRSLGLTVGPDDRVGIANIVSLLAAGNENQGFRYFNLGSVAVPRLSWTRQVVEGLMHAVVARVAPPGSQSGTPGAPAKLIIAYGVPVPKR
jgi:hypothetical protein